MFDAQCDFAAIVYGANDEPDRLLHDFAEYLRRSGYRVVEAIQHHSWWQAVAGRAVSRVGAGAFCAIAK
jgi:predicted CoA-binding protein